MLHWEHQNGALAGSHYNIVWTVHSAFTEALEILLFERFLAESGDEIPILLHHASQELFQNNNEILHDGETLLPKFLDFKNRVRNGELGKTAQSWLSFYIDLISI